MRIALALLAAALFVTPTSKGVADNFPTACCHVCGQKVCYPEAKVEKETRHCWEVECKEICIPAIRFPWMKCGPLHCGRVRAVKGLVAKDYECEKCVYEWKILCDQCRHQASKEEANNSGEQR